MLISPYSFPHGAEKLLAVLKKNGKVTPNWVLSMRVLQNTKCCLLVVLSLNFRIMWSICITGEAATGICENLFIMELNLEKFS